MTNAPINTNQQYLFGRAYTLALGAPYQTAAIQYSNFSTPQINLTGAAGNPSGVIPSVKTPVQQSASPLKIRFDIDRNSVGSANKSKIELFNLSVQSRQNIKKGWLAQLQAGYKAPINPINQNNSSGFVGIIFQGNVMTSGLVSLRSASEIISTIECGDGEASIALSLFNNSYKTPVTLSQILTDMAVQMKLSGVNAGLSVGIPTVVYPNRTFHGTIAESLTTLLKGQNLEWKIQNGSLNIIPISGYNQEQAQIVSVNTGMIGVPSKNAGILQFSSLLNFKLSPGSAIQMVSENTALNGYYRIRRSHYEGDTHGEKWQVTCECVDLPGVATILPAVNGFNFNAAAVA